MKIRYKVASYNILANSYAKPEWYEHIDNEVLKWSQRKLVLCSRVEKLKADIICLQEVEQDAFDLINNHLNTKGYQGIYAKKTRNKPDGCATFINRNKLNLQNSQTLYYQDKLSDEEDSGHLALITSIKHNEQLIKVVNSHIRWDSKNKDQHIGYRQVKELMDKCIKLENQVDWIICGDFNTEPNSEITLMIKDNGFIDSYESNNQYTCNANRRAKRIDYVFHSKRLIAKPTKLTTINDYTPLPSKTEPSDHLPILVSFF